MSSGGKRLRIGLIGAGRAARQLHLPALRRLPRIEVCSIADSDPARAVEMAASVPGARALERAADVLSDPALDAIAILTPPSTHAELVIAAIETGKHVLLEKPLAATPEECDRILLHAKRSRGVIAIGHNLRCHRLVRKARAWIQSGALGEIRAIATVWTSPPGTRPAWHHEPGSSVAHEIGVHHLDLVAFLTSSAIGELSASCHGRTTTVCGRVGAGAVFSCVWSMEGVYEHTIHISGSNGAVEFSCHRANSWRHLSPSHLGMHAQIEEVRQYLTQFPDLVSTLRGGGDWLGSYHVEWQEFVRSIDQGSPVICSPVEAADAVRFACRIPDSFAAPTAAATTSGANRLSVILAAKGGHKSIRHTLRHLSRQTVARDMELVVVSAGERFPIPEADHFRSVQVLSTDPDTSRSAANAMGVRAAQSPVVAFAEDHCFPDPDWAESLLDAHCGPHAAVGPVVRNGNPGSVVSWCDFLIGYGPWIEPSPAGQRPFLPGHNSSYKRAELLAYGERLDELLESETVLHYDMVSRGKSLYLEPRARTAHLNFAVLPVWVRVQYHCGRVFAGSRASHWTRGRKLFYAVASPLIPLVRLMRILKETMQPGRPRATLLRAAPMLLVGLCFDGAGQFAGYLAGCGDSPATLADFEYNRVRYISEVDRQRLESDHA